MFFFAELIFCFCLTTSFFVNSTPNIPSSAFPAYNTDALSLLEFKNGITQDPSGILSSWNDSVHFCAWIGVTCDPQHGRITKLDLQSHKLIGSISPSIGNLSLLTVLNLQNNSFHGEIPQQIGQLSRLQELVLGNNSLSGGIPINIFNCTNLVNLTFPYNQLVGKIPMEIGYLSKLVNFSVYSNYLSGQIPASFGNLSQLSILSLPYNSFKGSLPGSIGQLTHLTFLGLGGNNLSGMFPRSIYNLSSLTIFSIAYNQFYGTLPPDIGTKLPNLIRFSMGLNRFSGLVPASLFNASKLVVFDISWNNFTGTVPTNLGGLPELFRFSVASNSLGSNSADDLNFITPLTNCSKLGVLRITGNHFGGVFPNSIANLSNTLANLEIGGNHITGSIPSGIENLVNLSHLSMDRNQLIGSIPFSIGKLQNLKILNLSENRLSGPIPPSIGDLTQLLELSLAANNLTRNIPPSLSNCTYLQLLDISKNNLNGRIPEEVIGLSSLSISLNLSHNSLTGPLPVEVGSLKNLGVLDISHNKLSGHIPNTLGDCLRLERLRAENNFFQGNIPSSLSNLKGMQDFDLSRNNLSGEIPKDLEMLPLLQNLNLSFNNLEGEVPRGGIFRNNSVISVDGNTKLCGGIRELRLLTCPKHKSKHRDKSVSLKLIMVITSVIVFIILISTILICYLRRKSSKKLPSTSSLQDRYMRVSYGELVKATDGFSTENLLGVGSFGSVYKGTLDQDTKSVAVKVLNLQQRGASKSFMVECKALSKIRHRNLLKIITSCSSVDSQGNDFKALVFEFMPNGNLDNWLHPSKDQEASRNLSFEQRLNIALDVASALNYLHHHCQNAIIHCDLKPSNILLDAEFVARVGDFGLAKFLSKILDSTHKGETSSIAIKGSIGYLAPEYAMGSEVSEQGDVYSYGILVLEMFTGKRPTDEMFKDGVNLHNFCERALYKQVMEIMDPRLSFEDAEASCSNMEKWEIVEEMKHKCLFSVFQLGITCSAESPSDRMDIDDVVRELQVIKEAFLGSGMHVLDIK